jgi:ethanolamine utilization protein EutP
MRKIILIGRVAAGKTTLTQALRGEEIKYYKTQYVNYLDTVIDTPGEYTELRQTSGALALYSYEADVVGLVLSANEPYSIFSPCITSLVNREVIGIISGIDKPDANVERVERWLRLAGCKKIFPVSAVTGEGLDELKKAVYEMLEKLPPVKPLEFEEFNYVKPDRLEYEILKEGETFVIVGSLVEVLKRNVVMDDMNSLAYLHKVLKDRGIIKELRAMGATEKSTVIIGGEEFEFVD